MRQAKTKITFAAMAALALTLTLGASTASAKSIVDYFGTDPLVGQGTLGGEFRGPSGVAVNQTGNGAGGRGDVYVVDRGFGSRSHRIQRFSRDDNATPLFPYDDSWTFVSAWGADVVKTGGAGDRGDAADANYEICVVASQCKAGVPSAGNGTVGGNGGLSSPGGIAIDQDTGRVYVVDGGNYRVSVYEGDGAFVRSFGYDVVASGPGEQPAPDERQQLTITADGGKFSLLFRGASTGPTGRGDVPAGLRLVNNLSTISGTFAVGQGLSAFYDFAGWEKFPPGTTITAFTSGTITTSKAATVDSGGIAGGSRIFGHTLDFDASAEEIEDALNSLPMIGGVGGSVTVTGSNPFTVEFGGTLAGDDVPALVPIASALTSGAGTGSVGVVESIKGGALEACVGGTGAVCDVGGAGAGIGQIGHTTQGAGIAISTPDGNVSDGTVFVADTGNKRINAYDLEGNSPSTIGSAAVFDEGLDGRDPISVAVDSRGIVYAGADENGSDVERYDTQNVNGGGVGFLEPILAPVNEAQELTVSATGGQFRVSFDPDGADPLPAEVTEDLPYNATSPQLREALYRLPSIGGPENVNAFGTTRLFSITFTGSLGARDVGQLVVLDGTVPLFGGTGGRVTTVVDGHDGPLAGMGRTPALTVDPDTDLGGLDTDVLYAVRTDGGSNSAIQQFGPLNRAGETIPPAAVDADHSGPSNPGIAIDETSGQIYASSTSGGGQSAHGVYVLHDAGPPPTASLDSLSDVTATSVTAHATIDPNGPPPLRYNFEYSRDGTNWTATHSVLLGTQTDPQAIEAVLEPGAGFEPNTDYQVRLIARRPFVAPLIAGPLSFRTDAAPPIVETTGAPIRDTEAAWLGGYVAPRSTATNYHFEYGDQGPCDANPCAPTTSRSAGSGPSFRLVAERIEGLDPDTTYHYRVVADNGVPGSPVFGEDMAVTTRASDAPLEHGRFPGPPGSDRAYEQVNAPDTGGNPVGAIAFSDDGNRSIYSVAGGTPDSETGSLFNLFFAERSEGGWLTRRVTPARDQIFGADWGRISGRSDLSAFTALNLSGSSGGDFTLWRMRPDGAPQGLSAVSNPEWGEVAGAAFTATSADGTRTVQRLYGSHDPSHPASEGSLYDVSAGGDPQMISLMPDGAVPACGSLSGDDYDFPSTASRHERWVSDDGSLAFFPSEGQGPCGGGAPTHLYAHDFDLGQSILVSGPALSGPACSASFLASNGDRAYFWTRTRLHVDDTNPSSCTAGADDGDIYSYDLGEEEWSCLTCIHDDLDADVSLRGNRLSEDAARLYFQSARSLVAGAPALTGTYRLELASGELVWIATAALAGGAMNEEGSVVVIDSDLAALDPAFGLDSGDESQVYRYDDRDRSLACVSCPQDGTEPLDSSVTLGNPLGQAFPEGSEPNRTPLSEDGNLVFSTPTSLLSQDQNAPANGADLHKGYDVYEWRDGRLFLITDGLTEWPRYGPAAWGITPSGSDIFFTAPAQYTADAIDGVPRLYTARIGGGIEFPRAPPPCPLEVCQGTPRGAPDDPTASSESFSGRGNPTAEPQSCVPDTRAAKRLNKQAMRLRKSAARVAKTNPARAKALRSKARLKGRAANQKSRAARRCRRANREATR